jgi:glycosyltransferase involved in cell wall biosynthesis
MSAPRSDAPPSKSVLWVDAFLTFSDPSTRHLLYALPQVRAAGWKVRTWCLRSDIPDDEAEQVRLPAPAFLGPFVLIYFSVVVNLYAAWRWLRRSPRPATVIHATCSTYLGAEIASVHFLNCVWLRKQLSLGFGNWKEVAGFVLHSCGAIFERLHWWSPELRRVLPVSDSVGEEVRARTPANVIIETLPNAYDERRFNTAVRGERRGPCRKKLGYTDTDVVFVFVSLGHHKRKGFWLAVEGLAMARRDPTMRGAKFLVVGGKPATLEALQGRLAKVAPDWVEWIIFTGQQPDVESYLAAADAFLYPSYFEAFCLAEIEAAAMGLPLLLTPHHGSEMILEEGVNGLFLKFDPAAIAAAIRRFVSLGPAAFRRSTGRALTRSQYADRLLEIYERARQERASTAPGAKLVDGR